MEKRLTRHFSITGMVQGVGYRAGFAAEAQRLGLGGWVRNRRDGSVEAVACGNAAILDQLTEWARQGPRGAQVRAARVLDIDEGATDCGVGFEIRPTC